MSASVAAAADGRDGGGGSLSEVASGAGGEEVAPGGEGPAGGEGVAGGAEAEDQSEQSEGTVQGAGSREQQFEDTVQLWTFACEHPSIRSCAPRF